MRIETAVMTNQWSGGLGRGWHWLGMLTVVFVTSACGASDGSASPSADADAGPSARSSAAKPRGSASTGERVVTLGQLARDAEAREQAEPEAESRRPRRRTPGNNRGEESTGDPQHRPLPRRGEESADRGDLRVVYGELSNPVYQNLEEVFREERVLEDVLDELNAQFILPADLEIQMVECGEVNAFYDPNQRAVYMCYELLEHFLGLFGAEATTDEEWENAGAQGLAAFIFVFYHELGHALIDVLDLPVVGREEDAVDQLATVMLLETWEGEDSELALLSSAEWFGAESADDELDMADEHALSEQRYYNLLCWTFGSDPDYFSELTDEEWGLPEERAVRCPEEYAQMSRSWETLLGPHLGG